MAYFSQWKQIFRGKPLMKKNVLSKNPKSPLYSSSFLFNLGDAAQRDSSDAEQDKLKSNILKYFCMNDADFTTILIDMTFGDGHHTKYILEHMPNVEIICVDRDKEAFEKAKVLAKQDNRVKPVHGKFSDLPAYLKSNNYKFNSIHGILFDFGVSSSQLNSKRGFSFESNSVLDMRMDGEGITAEEVLNNIEEMDLAKILKVYGEEKKNKKIARAVIESRYTLKKLRTTSDLNELVESLSGTDKRYDPYKNKTEFIGQKVYNGLRRFVNNELNEINYAMIIAEKYLKPNGIMITSCESIVEDKVVKRHLTGNVIEHCANDLTLKFVNHNLTVDSETMMSYTSSPWQILTKSIKREEDYKLRVAMKL